MHNSGARFKSRKSSEKGKNHPAYEVEFDGRDEIDNLANLMYVVFDLPHYSITLRQNNPKNLGGRCHYQKHEIELFPIGKNAGVLLHEIAHIPTQSGHDKKFNNAQDAILSAYDEAADIVEHSYIATALDLISESLEEGINPISEVEAFVEDWNEDGRNYNLESFMNVVQKVMDLRNKWSKVRF
jgi:hypothetical protein